MPAPAPGPVRLGDHRHDLFPGGQDGLQGRQGKLGGPHEDQAPGTGFHLAAACFLSRLK